VDRTGQGRGNGDRVGRVGRVDGTGWAGWAGWTGPGWDVAMGRVGHHAGVGGFWGPVPPSKPILSRAEEDCPRAPYFWVGGGVFNETPIVHSKPQTLTNEALLLLLLLLLRKMSLQPKLRYGV
jgi:hypothetical protein